MTEPFDPREAGRAKAPAPPLWCAALGLLVFLAGSLLAYTLFIAIALAAAPTRNNVLLALGVFVLLAGAGSAGTLGIFVWQRLGRRVHERRLRSRHGEVFGDDWRSGEGD